MASTTTTGDLTKVGTSMLNMDDISYYLNHGLNFITAADKASDTEAVGGVKAENIAVAYQDPDSDKVDRNTVQNAKNLDGHGIDDFLLAAEGTEGFKKQETEYVSTTQDIENLRDEVYQLRAELAKKGVIERHTPYAGYYDPFRQSDVRYKSGAIGMSIDDSQGNEAQFVIHVADDVYDSLMVGDHLYLVSSNGASAVVEIAEKMSDHRRIRFVNATGFNINKEEVSIYRSKGTLMNGTFTFGQEASTQIDNTATMYTGLNDDTYHKTVNIDASRPGYGYTFRIPSKMQGNYLSKLDIEIETIGNPGALTCYIIDQNDITSWNEAIKSGVTADKSKTLEDLIIAKSQPLVGDSSRGDYIASFDFYDPTKEQAGTVYGTTAPDCYPCLSLIDKAGEAAVRYCMIIKADPTTLDEANYYKLRTLVTSTNADLQLNNTTYYYNESDKEPLKTDAVINSMDVFYGITLLKAVEKDFTPYEDGIYTAEFTQPAHLTSGSAVLEMRINREGVFNVRGDSAQGDQQDGATIVVEAKDAYGTGSLNGVNDGTLIVGENIAHVTNVNDMSLTLEKGLHVDAKAKVYPMGYKVALKASHTYWDEVNCVTVTDESVRYDMDLVEVVPDYYNTDNTRSDRLIFKADLYKLNEKGNKVHPQFNKFELEIYWKSSAVNNKVEKLNDYSVTTYPLAGAIKDLSLALTNKTE